MHISKWAQAARHFLPSLIGFPTYFFAHPKFALQLFVIRVRYFFTRRLKRAVLTPDQFLIESPEELVSYWSFFIEKETLAREWMEALFSEPEPVVVDVGANAGLFTHRVWTLNPKTKLIVFEPLPQMAKKIARWGETTRALLTLHNQAVADHDGILDFYASSDNDPTASLKPEATKKITLHVPVVTLNSAISEKKILMVKIDVEGMECEVLAGASQTLQHTRFLIIEAHTKTALERIKAQLTLEWRCRQIGASDYLFTRLSR